MGNRRRNPTARAGVAVVMVLMVMAMTLAVCYAMFRTQSTALVIQQNEELQILARQAAISGIRTALQRMSSADWEGINTSIQGTLSERQNFLVSYTAGDSSLSATDPAYQEYPYRVTILSTGRAVDPRAPQRRVVYQIRTVVRLVPRNFSIRPTDWSTTENYTIFQTHNDDFRINIPCQLQGHTRIQGPLRLAPNYPEYFYAWWYYLKDLNLMRSAGYSDCRPILGPIFLPVNRQEYIQLLALSSALGTAWTHLVGTDIGSDWTNPTLPTTYQLYQGGPTYSIPRLPNSLTNVTYHPDVMENPLGIYFCEGSIQLGEKAVLQGSLFCTGSVSLQNKTALIIPLDMPGLYVSGGTASTPVRLPSVSCREFYVSQGGEVRGLVVAFERFQVNKGPENVSFSLTGRLIARKIRLESREPWDTLPWQTLYQQYTAEQNSLPPTERYFPVWLGKRGRDPTPRITIVPDPSPVLYHWPRWDQPIFQPHPDDSPPWAPDQPGLRWELVQWTEQPGGSSGFSLSQTSTQSTQGKSSLKKK